ncbi:hypothetical protein KSD_77450 [Ktedonobacter sp. SOSP1-85]|nr:hypothetical protein KSD_77450 [Ktedonobacter sp. SOSP1-85]
MADCTWPFGIKHNRVGFSVTQPDGQGQFEGTTPSLVEDTPLQAGAHDKKLSL